LAPKGGPFAGTITAWVEDEGGHLQKKIVAYA